MKTFFLLLIIFFSKTCFAQDNFYIAPALSMGYTFAGGFNIGFDIDFGIWQDSLGPERELNTGFSYSMDWAMVYYDHFHRISSVNFFMATDYYDAKIGFGKVVDPHGYNKVNKCRTYGVNTDISFTDNKIYFPWIGLHLFLYNWNNWYGFNYPYATPYLKYKYDLMQTSGIKNFK